jgi:hypothetical protein
MTQIKILEKVYKCSLCGRQTEWDFSLGLEPLCVSCWDARAGVDNKVAAIWRAWYEKNKEKR